MKSLSLSVTLALLLIQDVLAFPTILNEMMANNPQIKARAGAPTGGAPDALAPILGFNTEKQYVSNTGEHAFVAPGSTDQRGPCPGKNIPKLSYMLEVYV